MTKHDLLLPLLAIWAVCAYGTWRSAMATMAIQSTPGVNAGVLHSLRNARVYFLAVIIASIWGATQASAFVVFGGLFVASVILGRVYSISEEER